MVATGLRQLLGASVLNVPVLQPDRCCTASVLVDPRGLWLCPQDVDAAFVERKAEDAKGVTFSGAPSHLLVSRHVVKHKLQRELVARSPQQPRHSLRRRAPVCWAARDRGAGLFRAVRVQRGGKAWRSAMPGAQALPPCQLVP
jgi:hypothetical protein